MPSFLINVVVSQNPFFDEAKEPALEESHTLSQRL
jgi:hypothetical protein